MQVQVSGKHVDVGEALRARIEDEIATAVGKYFERGGDAEVTVSRDRLGFRIDCLVNLASGQQLQSHGAGADARTAFDQASLYVLRAPDDTPDDEWSDLDASRPPAAMIIAETESVLETMTVSMAVMKLDLTESQTIVFRNAAHGGLSVVYRRLDGNIGWIDPKRTKAINGIGPPA